MQVAFYTGTHSGWPGVFNRAVRFWLGGPFSHVELIFSDGSSASSSAMDGGVRFKRIDFNPDKWAAVTVTGDEDYARAWFAAHLGAGYDYAGLAGFVWRPFAGGHRRWFCSEAVAAALGFPEPHRFDPCTLAAALSRRAL